MNLFSKSNFQFGRSERDRKPSNVELQLAPMIDMMTIMLIFLLLTASFIRIAILELNLPNLDSGQMRSAETNHQSVILNILLIRENGFELKSPDLKFELLPKPGSDYNWESLKGQLDLVKKTHPESSEIIISPENKIRYQVIIHVMDQCRAAGFPNISISG
jgi:biopolymer transport protein TolR